MSISNLPRMFRPWLMAALWFGSAALSLTLLLVALEG